jgi:hypothetical protein
MSRLCARSGRSEALAAAIRALGTDDRAQHKVQRRQKRLWPVRGTIRTSETKQMLWSPTVGAPLNDLVVPNQTAIRKANGRTMCDASYHAAIIGAPRSLAQATMERAVCEGSSR